jgi:hypothetical protein
MTHHYICLFLLFCFPTFLASSPADRFPYNTLKEVLPYNDFGWYYAQEPIEKIIKEKNVRVVIELGSWLGKSTRHIASLLPENGVVWAVDHWQGSIEHHVENYDYYPEMKTILPVLYEQFLSNVIHAELTHKIIPWKMTTDEAIQRFRQEQIHPDLIYVDASHDEESVYKDLCNYYPLIKEHGTICGDDWGWGEEQGFPVRRAVERFAKEQHLAIELYANNWVWVLVRPS